MPTKVYVVTSGSYSDYRINGVFSTKQKAQEYINNYKAHSETCYVRDFNNIEIYDLNEALKETEYVKYSVGIMLDDGSLEYGKEPNSYKYWGIPQNQTYIAENVPVHHGRSVARAESCKSAKHALKLAVEARQEWLRKKKIHA